MCRNRYIVMYTGLFHLLVIHPINVCSTFDNSLPSGQLRYMFRATGISGGILGLTRSGNLGSLPHTSTLLGGISSSSFASWSAVATGESSFSSDNPPGKLSGEDGDITSWQPHIQTYMQVA